jgi:hypothetical protein
MPGRKDFGDMTTLSAGQATGRRHAPAFNELDVVRLSRDFASAVAVIPRGTEATVLQIFDGGVAYQVEFEGPYEAPETVLASYLEASIARSASFRTMLDTGL